MKKFQFRSVVAMANSKLSVKYAAILLSFSTLISALLGIFRDRLLNSYYLDTYPTGIDAYTAAFTIPDFMFFVLTSGALAVSFIPVFNQRLVAGNKKSAWELSSSILNLMAIVTLISSILIMIFADPLVRYIVGPGLDESGTTLAINMMRVIAINPFLFSIATVLNSIQQAVGRFVFYSLAPALYNVGILIGITVFTNGINIFGLQLFEGGIMGVAIGVVFGAVLQIFISLIGLFGLGFDYQFKIYWKNLGFKTVLKLLPARSLDQGIDYVYSILIVWISLPVSVIAYFARGYVVSFVKNGGQPVIASILGSLVLAIFAQSIFHIASRGFYARQDTKTPFIVSIIAVGFTMVLSVVFSIIGLGPDGLGWAQSIGAILEIFILLFILQKKSRQNLLNKDFWSAFFRMLVATVVTSVSAYILTKLLPLRSTDVSVFVTIPKFLAISLGSMAIYFAASFLLDLEEVQPFFEKLNKILFRNLKPKDK